MQDADRYLLAVRKFADRILEHGRDAYGAPPTPLFVDGLAPDTLEPVKWTLHEPEEPDWVPSNQAHHQILFRMLTGLSNLTGEERYKQAAVDAIRYALTHLRRNGLIFWGGHATWDLSAGKPGFARGKGTQHELKCVFPFYELMWEVDPVETKRYIESFWNAHVIEWLNLEFSRHGPLDQDACIPTSDPWNNVYKGGPVFFVGSGLTFANTGTDLIHAAATLSRLNGDPRPLVWAKRLAQRYVETRNVKTGLSGYQFSISQLPGGRGDRARDQFGDQLRAHYPIEPILVLCRQIRTMLCNAGICKMRLSETLGEEGREFQEWVIEDLRAYAEHAYDETDNVVHPMLTDGLRLTGLTIEKKGYFGPAGRTFVPVKADAGYFWAYSLAYRLSGDPFLWRIARSVARGNGLGDIGATPQDTPAMDMSSAVADGSALFGALELYRATDKPAFLDFARLIGDNILAQTRQGDFFMLDRDARFAKLDNAETLALLHLYAALRDKAGCVPPHCAGYGAFRAMFDRGKPFHENIVFFGRVLDE